GRGAPRAGGPRRRDHACRRRGSDPAHPCARGPRAARAPRPAGRGVRTRRDQTNAHEEEAVTEATIPQRIEDFVKALCAKVLDGVMSFYAPDLVSFDLAPPLRYFGADGKRRAWQEAFAAFRGPIAYEVRDLKVTTNGELAFAHSLNHIEAT